MKAFRQRKVGFRKQSCDWVDWCRPWVSSVPMAGTGDLFARLCLPLRSMLPAWLPSASPVHRRQRGHRLDTPSTYDQALTLCPWRSSASPFAGEMKLTLNSTVGTAASGVMLVLEAYPQALSTIMVTMPARTKPCCWVWFRLTGN